METRHRSGEKSWKDWAGLNRTMQYGNQLRIRLNTGEYLSLNRTMQYGNDQYRIERN